jgi:hypothetical protein
MKQMRISLLMLLITCLVFGTASAQIETPAASQLAKFSQKVGLTEVSIEYSRPSMNGRKIYGNLVPFGSLWRTGANMATKLSFSDDVKIGGKDLKAGTYALFTIPGKDEWTIILSTNINQGGTGSYKEAEDALRVTVKPSTMDVTVETFLISIDDVKMNKALIEIVWENTVVQIPLEVSIDARIEASIQKTLNPSPSANDYFAAAAYYREAGKDLNQALTWINECLKIHEAANRNVFWIYRQKSLIEADMKNYKGAVKTAEISLAKATEAKNDDYIKMNKESIAEWSKK